VTPPSAGGEIPAATRARSSTPSAGTPASSTRSSPSTTRASPSIPRARRTSRGRSIPPASAAGVRGREHVVRARYDGPDLDEVASRAGLSREDAIRAHADRAYVVRLVGFLPGFAYLGPVAPPLALPRRPTPRTRVDPCSIGVAGGYTGVYPFASPGGWHLIARAVDFAPFDAEHGARLALGDRVRFEVAT
jgi:allophanate hydrolase subunit 1